MDFSRKIELNREIEHILVVNKEFDFIDEIFEIEQLLKEIDKQDKDYCIDEVVCGYCMAKKEGCQTFDEIIDQLEKWDMLFDTEYPDIYLNYEGKWRVRL